MLSFVEAFKIMGVVFLVMIPLVALLKDPKKHGVSKSPSPQPAINAEEDAP